jgi:hypothetical protein
MQDGMVKTIPPNVLAFGFLLLLLIAHLYLHLNEYASEGVRTFSDIAGN